RWVGRWRKTRTEQAKVHRRIQGRTSSLARQFDQLTDLLVELDYLVATEDGQLHPTDCGLRLRRLFSDRDLLIAECIEHGAWQGLDPAGLAAVVSAAVHEGRRDDDRAPELIVDAAVDAALEATFRTASALQAAESRDRKSTRLNSSHVSTSYAVFCLKKKKAHPWASRGRRGNSRDSPARSLRGHGCLLIPTSPSGPPATGSDVPHGACPADARARSGE